MPYYDDDNHPPWRPDWVAIGSWLVIFGSIVFIAGAIGQFAR